MRVRTTSLAQTLISSVYTGSQISRAFTCSSVVLHSVYGGKNKLSITLKKITKDNVEVIKSKSIESVIKKFNYENYKVFGRVISPVTGNFAAKASVFPSSSSYKVKPPTTFMPVKQPKDEWIPMLKEPIISQENEGYLQACDVDSQPRKVSPTLVLNAILEFPLHNLKSEVNKSSGKNIDKVKHLRQHLLSISENEVPSVTKILDKTMPPERAEILDRWKSGMIEKMGKERFEEYQKGLLSAGSLLHEKISAYLSGSEEAFQINPENAGHWNSLQTVLCNINDIKLLEERVTHPFLQYKGVIDCIAKYRMNTSQECFHPRDHWVLIEWKTSQKQKATLSSTYDYPLQIAAYAGALNFDPQYRYMAHNGLIVVAYEGGSPASVHFMNKENMQLYWDKWLRRLKLFWEMR